MSSPRVAVVGGSVGGLSAAILLARRGHRVVVLERDASPTPDNVDDAGAWRRRATPQAAHSHAFLARSRAILAAEAPDVLDAMIGAGVRQTVLADDRPRAGAGCNEDLGGEETDPRDANPREANPREANSGDSDPADAELVVLNARRSVFEWVLRRAAEREPGVEMRLGVTVTAVDTHRNGSLRVTGVATDAGLVPADVVVDAGGKRSPVRGWFVGEEARDREVSCGISYLTRFYRLRGPEPSRLNRGFTHGASFDSYSCLVFPADNGAFSITFGVLPEDRDMRALRDPAAFAAAAAAIPAIAPWVDPEVSVPTSDVALMASLSNLLRAPIADAPLGLHSIGDARCVTNPAHTRGTTLALVGAQRLADIVTNHAGDPVAQADAMEAFTACELAAWVEDSVAQDRARLTRWRKGEAPPEPRWVTAVSNGEASVAAQCDGEAWRAFTRLQNALALPGQVLDDSALEAAVARVNRSGWRPPAMEAPDRNELAAIARSAAGAAGS